MAESRGSRRGAPRVELVRDLDRPTGYLLSVDGVAQSYVDLADPTHLELEYVGVFAQVVDACFDEGRRLDVVHLGAGACTFARYLAATRAGSRQRAYDVDPDVTQLVTDRLGVDRVAGLTLHVADARDALAARPEVSAHVVVSDVFDGPHADVSTVTREALTDVRRVLRPRGVYVANIADKAPFAFAKPVLATLRSVFDHVALLADPGALRGRRYGNLVLVASRRALPVDELARRAAGAVPPVRLVAGERLATFVGNARPTTDRAPAAAPVLRSWMYDRSEG